MNAGQRLAAYGRRGDNNLVHVSDRELRGIETLTGRKFTRNPDTGLPEAFGFADLIPIAAGIGGTLVGGPLVGAAAAGATRTGVSAAQGKDFGSALTDGVIAGATGYATAGLMSGVGEAASGAAGAAAGAPTGSAVSGSVAGPSLAPGGITAQALPPIDGVALAPSGYNAVSPLSGATPAAAPGVPTVVPANPMTLPAADGISSTQANAISAGVTAQPVAPSPASPAAPGFADRVGTNLNAGMSRFSNIMSDPGTAAEKFTSNVAASPGRAGLAALGTYGQLSGMMDPVEQPEATSSYDPSKRLRNPPQPRDVRMPGADYRPGFNPEFRYFAEGGLASLPQSNNPDSARNLMNEAAAALLGEHPKPQRAIERFVDMFGEGALEALQDRIAGGRVRGAGGGLDDLVPGDIEGRQRVRLADGEFVIPSDVVSGLGDGSTDQGVRKLHEMMDNVRRQRTGTTKQPGHINDAEALPA